MLQALPGHSLRCGASKLLSASGGILANMGRGGFLGLESLGGLWADFCESRTSHSASLSHPSPSCAGLAHEHLPFPGGEKTTHSSTLFIVPEGRRTTPLDLEIGQ